MSDLFQFVWEVVLPVFALITFVLLPFVIGLMIVLVKWVFPWMERIVR